MSNYIHSDYKSTLFLYLGNSNEIHCFSLPACMSLNASLGKSFFFLLGSLYIIALKHIIYRESSLFKDIHDDSLTIFMATGEAVYTEEEIFLIIHHSVVDGNRWRNVQILTNGYILHQCVGGKTITITFLLGLLR